jgi:hypothetical protein
MPLDIISDDGASCGACLDQAESPFQAKGDTRPMADLNHTIPWLKTGEDHCRI